MSDRTIGVVSTFAALAGLAQFPIGIWSDWIIRGSALVYSTYLGGSGIDIANGIAVDAAGNAYVAGNAGSPDPYR